MRRSKKKVKGIATRGVLLWRHLFLVTFFDPTGEVGTLYKVKGRGKKW
jgi:hypothetical protein